MKVYYNFSNAINESISFTRPSMYDDWQCIDIDNVNDFYLHTVIGMGINELYSNHNKFNNDMLSYFRETYKYITYDSFDIREKIYLFETNGYKVVAISYSDIDLNNFCIFTKFHIMK